MSDRSVRKRVTVTHPMTRAVQSGRSNRASSVDLRGDPSAGDDDGLVLHSLMRAQLRLAVQSFGVLLGVLSSVVFVLASLTRFRPSLLEAALMSIPVVWWCLGLLMFPVLFVIAQAYVTQVERLERQFQALNREAKGGS